MEVCLFHMAHRSCLTTAHNQNIVRHGGVLSDDNLAARMTGLYSKIITISTTYSTAPRCGLPSRVGGPHLAVLSVLFFDFATCGTRIIALTPLGDPS